MATDNEVIGVAEEEPDTSDLSMVIINVETWDERQLSFPLGPEVPEDKVSLTMTHTYGADDEEWLFRIRRSKR